MFVDIFVARGDGLKRGPDITSPLVTETVVALELGRNLLDKNSKFTPVNLVVIYRPGLRVGQLVAVHDALQGESWRGKITSVSLAKRSLGGGMEAHLKVQRPV